MTDYSSAFYDYLHLSKPIVFYPYDYEKFINKARKLHFSLYELPGPHFFKLNEMLKEVKKLTSEDFNSSEKRKAFYRKFCSWDLEEPSRSILNRLADHIK